MIPQSRERFESYPTSWDRIRPQYSLGDLLTRLKGTTNAVALVELAAVVESEEQARFLCHSVEMLGHYHEKGAPLRELRVYFGVPAAVTADGALVVATGVDLLSWTKVTADFAEGRAPADGRSVLLASGLLTPRAREGFAARGWQVTETPAHS
jgi:hypothetical protein